MNPHYLAAVLQGEAGVLGLPGMFAVGICAMSRLTWDDYQPWQGFYGYQQPSQTALFVAQVMLSVPPQKWVELYGRYPYCLSKSDVKRLGFPKGDIVISRGKYQVHMYRRWPG